MKIYGSFVNIKKRLVSLTINIPDSTSADLEISDGAALQFADSDTIVTESGVNDSMDVLQQHSATIALQANKYIEELFSREYKDASVEVSLDGNCVFSGWLEPRALSMPFNDFYDDLSLSCIDCLSALQYSPFRGIKSKSDYETVKSNSGASTFQSLINDALVVATNGNGAIAEGFAVYYDCSRSLPGKEAKDVFSQLEVSDLAFLGDDADDVETWQDVLEAVLKYLDLHIVQYGKAFYIYSWESVRKGGVTWTQILTNVTDAAPMNGNTAPIVLSESNVEDDGAQIDVGEIFNKLELKVSPKSQDSFLASPVDGDGVSAVAGTRKQVYCVEIASDGDGTRAHDAFKQYVVEGKPNGYENLSVKDWYVRLYNSSNWKFGSKGEDWTKDAASIGQEHAITKLSQSIGCLLLECGARDTNANLKDNSPTPTVSTEKWLVVSVNGNGEDDEDKRYPKGDDLRSAYPVATFTGGTAGGVYSPADNDTVNYLVISGTIILSPRMLTSGTHDISEIGTPDYDSTTIGHMRERYHSTTPMMYPQTVPSRTNEDGRLLMFDWYRAATPLLESPSINDDDKKRVGVIEDLDPQGAGGYSKGWIPYTADGEQLYPYKRNPDNSTTDKVSKVDVLVCMLIIGNIENGTAKVLVEDIEDEAKCGAVGSKKNNFKDSAFSWQPYKKQEDCTSDDEYWAQTFTIGFDPKIGDDEYIVGKEYDIGTNFDFTTGITAEKGMAIPMPHDAHLSGPVKFYIIGPADEMWNETIYRHRTWFRKKRLNNNERAILSHTSSIIIKSFDMKMYSDSETEDVEGEDIIYSSKTDEDFYNKKDGLEMKIHSGFTTAEIQAYGLTDASALTTVINGTESLPMLKLKDIAGNRVSKPEMLYVDAYYNELHKARIVLTQNLQDGKDDKVSPFRFYEHKALNRKFYVRDMGLNLMEGSAQMKLEECF